MRPTGRYEQLDNDAQLKNVLSNWDPVFIQFKDPNGEWLSLYMTCDYTVYIECI